jgi:hypothetical protein
MAATGDGGRDGVTKTMCISPKQAARMRRNNRRRPELFDYIERFNNRSSCSGTV